MKITNTLKQKSKEFCNLSAYVIAAILITSPLAFAAPFQVSQGIINTKFGNTSDSAAGCSSNSTPSSCFYANSYDDFHTGEQQGTISVYSYSSGSLSELSCYGSAYAGIISVNKGSGSTSIKATLNPSNPSCRPYNWNAGIVTVNLSGSYIDGGDRSSSNAKSTRYSNGTMEKSDFKADFFEETFTGFITGYSGPWIGDASASRHTNRQQVK